MKKIKSSRLQEDQKNPSVEIAENDLSQVEVKSSAQNVMLLSLFVEFVEAKNEDEPPCVPSALKARNALCAEKTLRGEDIKSFALKNVRR